MNASIPDEIRKEAEKVSSLIATARRLMGENKSIDLSKLEHKVSVLCKKAETTDLGQKDDIQGLEAERFFQQQIGTKQVGKQSLEIGKDFLQG